MKIINTYFVKSDGQLLKLYQCNNGEFMLEQWNEGKPLYQKITEEGAKILINKMNK